MAINLASDIAGLGDAAAAREIGEDTYVRLRSLLGDNHPVTLGCAANLVVDMGAHGAEEEASRLAEDTLERYARTLGRDHPDTKVAAQGAASTSTSTPRPSDGCRTMGGRLLPSCEPCGDAGVHGLPNVSDEAEQVGAVH